MSNRDVPREQMLLGREQASKMPDGCYSGDKPNPNLRAFVERHIKESPYDPGKDEYVSAAFDKAIETTKNSAIFSLHPYHLGKKPHDAIEAYIAHFTKPGDLVLDPFCGSGSTAVASLIRGRKAIAIDVSPAATFVTRYYVTPTDPLSLQVRFEAMLDAVSSEMSFLYGTRCHVCNGLGILHHVVYSNAYECPRCLTQITLFEASQFNPPKCPECLRLGHIDEPINSKLAITAFKPVAISFSCHGSCRPKRMIRSVIGSAKERAAFERIDLEHIREIESRQIPHWYPKQFMMNVADVSQRWGDEWRPSRNFRRVSDLFTHRNLWAIAALMEAAGGDDDLRAVITSGMLAMSRKAQHLDGGGGYIPGNWALPPMSKQRNVIETLQRVFGKTCSAKEFLSQHIDRTKVCISTQSATAMHGIPTGSVDYIFTDPPYGGAVQYAELNFLWEAWLGVDTSWHDQEVIVNKTRGRTESYWAEMMGKAFSECFRVLKPGRWLSLCYHDTSEGTWALVQDIMAEVGFVVGEVDKAVYIDTGGNTYNQRVADKVTKRDLVVNFRKPKPGEAAPIIVLNGDEDRTSFNEKARAIVRDYLEASPGSTKDRVYDHLVSRMVRAGEMEPHNFEELLGQVAEEVKEPVRKNLFENQPPNLFGTHEIGRWYLKEHEAVRADEAEAAKEDGAALSVRTFVKKGLEHQPEIDGVHYSDIFEHYVFSVTDKPRRLLAEWMPDYFYKTEEGTWRLPRTPEEEQIKTDGRARGTSRQVKRFVSFLEQGVPVPERERPNGATLADWIRHCKRSGLYQQGKLLYEKGGLKTAQLDEVGQAGVEEDYQVCCRILSRAERTK